MISKEKVFDYTLNKLLSPVKEFLSDPDINEIMINGPEEVYIEKKGQIRKTEAAFYDEELLIALAKNIAQYSNKRVTDITSRFDSRLPDGSRVHVIMPRCSRKGVCISIRRFPKDNFTLEGLVQSRDGKVASITNEAKEYIETIVGLEKNLIVSCGTGTGKTSFLNAVSLKIPDTERIIVIEDSSELRLQQPHVLPFETVMPNRKGEGATSIRDLFHSALRMRPDRIVIGECRGGEALDLIQAMTSGHGGSMSTLHANTAVDALRRLETMALMSGIEIPLSALRTQIASAIEVVIQLTRMEKGDRVVEEIAEVGQISSSGDYTVKNIFKREKKKDQGYNMQKLFWTGERSKFAKEVNSHNMLKQQLHLTEQIFDFTESEI